MEPPFPLLPLLEEQEELPFDKEFESLKSSSIEFFEKSFLPVPSPEDVVLISDDLRFSTTKKYITYKIFFTKMFKLDSLLKIMKFTFFSNF